jgi:AcrR family transcriptional regulator
MNVNRQEQRSAATRAKLVRAARRLFAAKGYSAVGTEQIVRRAGVTRGALYHQFPAKDDLFLAVYEQVESELTQRVGERIGEAASPVAALRAGIRIFLEECRDPAVQRIVLIDGPAVLGWERWREVADRYGLGLLESVLKAAVGEGEIAPLRVDVLAHVLMGAVDEAALLVVEDPDSAAAAVAVFDRLIDGLARPARPRAKGGRRR